MTRDEYERVMFEKAMGVTDKCSECGLMDIGGGHPAHRPDCPKVKAAMADVKVLKAHVYKAVRDPKSDWFVVTRDGTEACFHTGANEALDCMKESAEFGDRIELVFELEEGVDR